MFVFDREMSILSSCLMFFSKYLGCVPTGAVCFSITLPYFQITRPYCLFLISEEDSMSS